MICQPAVLIASISNLALNEHNRSEQNDKCVEIVIRASAGVRKIMFSCDERQGSACQGPASPGPTKNRAQAAGIEPIQLESSPSGS